ncbi:amidase [Halorubrum sp. AD140]|uniref:amidase n=1 Tax=Halorubrum sp. AD140 TaxID=3050073 RepID=UPI002ACCD64C|nr:amidase [Halorubrum sp. AD140]MDZ5811551.1 amidase [Halorubrum sp. AD140]
MLHQEPLAVVADDLRSGRIDLETYLDELEDRTATVEPEIESLVEEPARWDRLRSEATALAERYPDPAERPPLYGVPVGVKDIFHVDGLSTRAGSDFSPEALAGDEAASVTALREAGALVLGKTVTTEFAHMSPGPTRNPHDTSRTPGGSSSGSAAAVAAGLCPVAFGTQTIGSVIRPAAFCGIVGYKPSFGRIPTDGVIPLSESVDHVGLFTQDTAGLSLCAPLLCDSWRTLPAPAETPAIGVPDGTYLEQASDVALDAFEDHVSRLTAAGYDVNRVDALSDIGAINERHRRLVAADAAVAHEDRFRDHESKYADETHDLIAEGLDATMETVAVGRRSRGEVRASLTDLLDRHELDLWIAPAAPGPAPEGIDSTGDPVMNLPWTHAGLPTVTVPAGETDEGLPLGVQFAGRYRADEDVIRWSHGIADTLGSA